MYFNIQEELDKLSPIERYILCCNIIGKEKTDKLLSKRIVRARIKIKTLWRKARKLMKGGDTE